MASPGSAAFFQHSQVRTASRKNVLGYDAGASGSLFGEYDGAGNLIQETVWLGDLPVATLRPNGSSIAIYYIVTDQLGTPREVVRPSDNALMWTWFTGPFGGDAPNTNPQGAGAFTFDLRFPGQIAGAWGSTFQNNHRDYDPAVGKYVESDTLGLAAGVNTYTYVRAKPIDHIDKTGLITTNGSSVTEDENTIICDGLGHVVTHLAPLDPLNAECLGDCIEQHELSHVQDALAENAKICVGQKKGILVLFSDRAEIKASEAELACLRKKLNRFLCGKCDDVIKQRITQMERYRDRFK